MLVVHAPVPIVHVWFGWDTLIAFEPLAGALPQGFPASLFTQDDASHAPRLSKGRVSAEFIVSQRDDSRRRWRNVREHKTGAAGCTWLPQAFARDAPRLREAMGGGAAALLAAIESLPPPSPV